MVFLQNSTLAVATLNPKIPRSVQYASDIALLFKT